MHSPIELITFRNDKYGEQVVAIKGLHGRFNTHLFDAAELFMEEDTWAERLRVKDEAEQFAKRFVDQMNAHGEHKQNPPNVLPTGAQICGAPMD